ncbi:MAG: hydroxymethylglutaryl-CoA reductase, degradative [Candidatus Altiarchaeota archaeon]
MVESRMPGFYKKTVGERRREVVGQAGLSGEEEDCLKSGGLDEKTSDRMIENVVGLFSLPLGVATNFLINGRDYLIPMATEEPSVVAAASNAAKMARGSGGFTVESGDQLMIGQIQVVGVDPGEAGEKVLAGEEGLLELANQQDPVLVKFGGGARRIEARSIDTKEGPMLVVHVIVDVRDAMGANAVNTMCEALAPEIESLTGGEAILRIISNYAVERVVKASALFPAEKLGGDRVVERILKAYALADADVHRAVTHNKGIMNGISAVVRATGNDTRAVEAGCHAYACRDGRYRSLTRHMINGDGDLEASIEVPIAVGIIGGATKSHPVAHAALKIMGVKSAGELSGIIAAVGLAQNLAALRALSDEGIQKGHMGLHARNIAVMAGAGDEIVDEVARELAESGTVRMDKAREIIKKIKEKSV